MIPILHDHDPSKIVGFAEWVNGCLRVTVKEGQQLTRAEVFATFGNCGIRVMQFRSAAELEYVEQFEIYEWSV